MNHRVRQVSIAMSMAATLFACQPSARAATLLDGTTRAQMTAVNPALEGFYASGSASVGGDPLEFNTSLTHLWGKYYAAARHSVTGGQSVNAIYLGRDYKANPGAPIAIEKIDVSSATDMAIITAATANDTPRDPNSRLVGIAVAITANTTIYNTFLANLGFINQITGSSITEEQVLSGNSIIAAPVSGDHVWSSGYGAWGTPATGVFNPDGLPTQWQAPFLASGVGLGGEWSDPNIYRATSFINDGGITNGPMNGRARSIDSGSPGIVIVPEPAGLMVFALAAGGCVRRRGRQSC